MMQSFDSTTHVLLCANAEVLDSPCPNIVTVALQSKACIIASRRTGTVRTVAAASGLPFAVTSQLSSALHVVVCAGLGRLA